MDEPRTRPFRADQVGSLLRPGSLLEARRMLSEGDVSPSELRETEDACIRDIVARQEAVGLKSITDGEFRRTLFHRDFISKFDGLRVKTGTGPDNTTNKQEKLLTFEIHDKLTRPRGIQTEDFEFLRSTTKQTPKVCIPSPSLVRFRGNREDVDRDVYPDMDQFLDDLARCYREEIQELGSLGCTYLQIDDTNFAYLCDPKMREQVRSRGFDPETLPHLYSKLINDSIRGRPSDMTVAVHLCRGNKGGVGFTEGGYEPVAETLFNEIEVDGFFLEYDTPRAGDFTPLRHVPPGKRIVLGLISTRGPELASREDVVRRIDEAEHFVPLDQLCLSPQCGFSSAADIPNPLSMEDQFAKLRQVVEIADGVWGDA